MHTFAHLRVDVNAKTEDGATLLVLARSNGHLNVVTELLNDKGINVSAADADGATALICAIRKFDVMRGDPPFDKNKNALYGMRSRFPLIGGYLVCLGRTIERLTIPAVSVSMI